MNVVGINTQTKTMDNLLYPPRAPPVTLYGNRGVLCPDTQTISGPGSVTMAGRTIAKLASDALSGQNIIYGDTDG